jgi:hypothetical protein
MTRRLAGDRAAIRAASVAEALAGLTALLSAGSDN